MDLDKAVDTVIAELTRYQDADTEHQARLRDIGDQIQKALDQAKQRQDDAERAQRDKRNTKAQERKALRDKLIPQWCVDNFQVGMIVKVKAKSSQLRKIEEVGQPSKWHSGSFTGRHCHFARLRDTATNEISVRLLMDGYITDHVYTNVTGVVTGVDKRGRAIVTPIMDFIEGRTDFDPEAALAVSNLTK